MSESFVKFNRITVPRSRLVAAIRRYIGFDYSMKSIYVCEHSDGTITGKTDCLRLLLMACKDVGFLPKDFSLTMRRPRNAWGRPPSADETVWQMLHTNCNLIGIGEAKEGDVMLMLYDDVDPRLNEIHHVAMKTAIYPWPYGKMIHAYNYEADGGGAVREVTIDNLCMSRVRAVYSIKGLVDG